MILDKELEFSAAQVVTGSAPSTNVVDLGVGRDIGTGTMLEIVVTAKTALTGTLVATLQGSVDEAFTSPVPLQVLPSFPLNAPIGSTRSSYVVPEFPLPYRYLRLNYTGLTGGTVAAYMATGVDHVKNYADAITIS